MRIVSAHLRNFRCFQTFDVDFESPVVLIYGPNGSGKTSILEALHYACYLRSFKTHLPREIIRTHTEGFGIGVNILSEGFDNLHIQFSKSKKTVKLNEQGIKSYKELYDAYKVVTITEDDLLIIQGAPSLRRSFLDHMVLLMDPDYALVGKKYKAIVENRTALIASGRNDQESYILWTNQLLLTSGVMQRARKKMLALLAQEATQLLSGQLGIEQPLAEQPTAEQSPTEQSQSLPQEENILSMNYEYARPYKEIEIISTAEELLERYPSLMNQEFHQKRSLLGAHLDDFSITYLGKPCRTYASRGQQKFILFLLKLAQLKSIRESGSLGTILLVDDFMTDFDDERAQTLLHLMTKFSSQVIITSPSETHLKHKLAAFNPQLISLKAP